MFTRKPTSSPKLQEAVDVLLTRIAETPYDSKETPAMVDQVTKLVKLTENDRRQLSADTLLVVVGNLIGIVLILRHEELNVITSKAISFVMRLR